MEVFFYKYIDAERCLSPCARVDDFSSLVFTRSYSGIGTWQMVLPLSSANIPNILTADVIHIRDGTSGLITKLQKSVSEGKETLTLSGTELKGLVRGRIVLPDNGYSHMVILESSPGWVVMRLLLSQLLNPEDDSRKVPGTSLNVETADRITYRGRFSSLEEDIQSICEEFSLGYSATVNFRREIKWNVFRGTDHRKSQNVNSKMIFSFETDTLESSSLEIIKNSTNWVLVAGAGEGTERATATLGTATGFRRFETYVDARDVEDSTLLPQRASEKLSEFGDSVIFSCRLSENTVEKYRKDFDLGDLCTVVDEIGGQEYSVDARITEITECYEDNALTLDVSFGYDKTGLGAVLTRIKTDTKALKNKE